MSFQELPAYLRRDLRRQYGQFREVYPLGDINAMRLAVESFLADGFAAYIEGWALRQATEERSVRRAAALVCHGKGWAHIYSRRGDLVFLFPEPA